MLFAEALKALRDGKNVKRECWVEEDGYLKLLRGMKHVWKIIIKPAPNAGNHIFSADELDACDWQVWEDDKPYVAENSANLEDKAA